MTAVGIGCIIEGMSKYALCMINFTCIDCWATVTQLTAQQRRRVWTIDCESWLHVQVHYVSPDVFSGASSGSSTEPGLASGLNGGHYLYPYPGTHSISPNDTGLSCSFHNAVLCFFASIFTQFQSISVYIQHNLPSCTTLCRFVRTHYMLCSVHSQEPNVPKW